MMRVKLELSDKSKPELVRTIVEYKLSGRSEVIKAVRGLDEGAYPSEYKSFSWTQGVRAITILLLRWAAWGRYLQCSTEAPQPFIKGRRPSIAASINDVITKNTNWLAGVFGSDASGKAKTEFIKRSNPDFNTSRKRPVEITIDKKILPPLSIRIKVGDCEVADADEIMGLVKKIEIDFLSKMRKGKRNVPKNHNPSDRYDAKTMLQPERSISTKGNPPPPPDLFFGRDEDLQKIKYMLGIESTVQDNSVDQRISVICGLPGVGKSTFVAALANNREVAQAFPDGVLWTSLGPTPNLIAELANWGNVMGNENVAKSYDVSKACEQLRIAFRNKRMLLIVDDVWETGHAVVFKGGGPACRVLFSTRLPDLAQTLALCSKDIYTLAPLQEQAALALFEHLVPEITRDHRDACVTLIRQLEGLPLAIRVAAGLLQAEASYEWGVENLISELQTDIGRILESEAPIDMFNQTQAVLPTVATLFARSTDKLEKHTRKCFAMLGAFAPKPATFDLEAMAAVWEVNDAKVIVRSLVSRGLLEPVGEGRFQMHSLLVTHARTLCSE